MHGAVRAVLLVGTSADRRCETVVLGEFALDEFPDEHPTTSRSDKATHNEVPTHA
jgi:hypothetical protein